MIFNENIRILLTRNKKCDRPADLPHAIIYNHGVWGWTSQGTSIHALEESKGDNPGDKEGTVWPRQNLVDCVV